MSLLQGKTIVLGVTGGIAAYKAAILTRELIKLKADVHVIMTKNATEFVTPLTFETLSNNKVSTDTFDRNFQWNVAHISLAKCADAFVIAPATANIIAKMANGIADDMLSTTVMAAVCPKIVAPAMNTNMYENPATQRNIQILKDFGIISVEPDTGFLAEGHSGKGRLADIEKIVEAVILSTAYGKDLLGKNVLVSAGATKESIDPVRYITNGSSGKMGIEVAKAAYYRGAKVTLVCPEDTKIPIPLGIRKIYIQSAKDMYDVIISHAPEMDVIIKAAAVGDFCVENYSEQKIKKSDKLVIELTKNPDILFELGKQKKHGQFICGFSMETENLVENSRKKLINKNADMIVANNLFTQGAGFKVDTNVATIITELGAEPLKMMSKEDLAHQILNRISLHL